MQEKLHSAAELTEYINKVGMLPLLRLLPGLGWSAEEVVYDDCQYVVLPDGGWEWLLWDWKGDIIREGECAYGKFFLLAAVADKFRYLKVGVSILLAFIGAKMLIHEYVEIGAVTSLVFILVVLAVSIGASILIPERKK